MSDIFNNETFNECGLPENVSFSTSYFVKYNIEQEIQSISAINFSLTEF